MLVLEKCYTRSIECIAKYNHTKYNISLVFYGACTITWSNMHQFRALTFIKQDYLIGILDDFDILCSKLISI